MQTWWGWCSCWGSTSNKTECGIKNRAPLTSLQEMWKAFPDIALHLHPTFPVTSTKALRTTFIPSFTTFWARRQGVVCKRKMHRAKRHLKFYIQIYRSQWRVKTEVEESWKRLMMDSSELFTRKLRKHFESPPKREQIGPTLQQKGIFCISER